MSGRKTSEWVRYLTLAHRTRQRSPAVLAVFDGDADLFERSPFCAVHAARALADRGRQAGAGSLFSLAVVFLRCEYESILVAAAAQLPGMAVDVPVPADPEAAPRDAKRWLDERLPEGYDPVGHQLPLTQAVDDWGPVRERMRSFRRLDAALVQLARAVSAGEHVATPVPAAGVATADPPG